MQLWANLLHLHSSQGREKKNSVAVYHVTAIRSRGPRPGRAISKLPSSGLRVPTPSPSSPKGQPRENRAVHASCLPRFTACLPSRPPHHERPPPKSARPTAAPPASDSAAIGARTASNPDAGRHVTNVLSPRGLPGHSLRSLRACARPDAPPSDRFQGGRAHAPRDTRRPFGSGAGG